MDLKWTARNWLPPVAWRLLGRLAGKSVRWAGDYPDWTSASSASEGYASDAILERVARAARRVRSGEAAFERDSVAFARVVHSYPVLAAMLRTACRFGGTLSVLDFGGSLGSSYFQCRRFFPPALPVSWGVVEQPHFAKLGREEFESDQLKFFSSIESCKAKLRPNIVLCSSTLQYVERPVELLAALGSVGADCIAIDRTPMWARGEDRLVVQRVPRSIYQASYPCWIFSEERLLKAIPAGYEVLDCFDGLDGTHFVGLRAFSFRGMILQKIDADRRS